MPSGTELLRLNPAVVVTDVDAFTAAIAAGRYADAVRAYGGPLLTGFHVDDAAEFEYWLDGERTRLVRRYGEALGHLATAAEAAGNGAEAVGWWARAAELDPLNSRLVLKQVRALAAVGDRANAIKLADLHARRLHDELDLPPDREMLESIERIRRDEQPPVPERPARLAAPPSVESAPVPSFTATTRTRWRRVKWPAGLAAAVVLAGGVAAGRWFTTRPAARFPRTAIAVLPFTNLSTDSSHAYFAAGLHDEVLSQLAMVAALQVIGRTSVGGYRDVSTPIGRIGNELAVGSVVEGSVQVDGNKLRVIVQLLDPVSQAELWTAHYDTTLDDAFAVQSEIAQRIVRSVGAKLTDAEAGAIASAPTQNPRAYQLYLRGLEVARRPGLVRQDLEVAQSLYERALALDPGFARAHAALSLLDGEMYHLRYDPSATRLELQQREGDAALSLAPDLPQARLAVGLSRAGRNDFRGALDQIRLGLGHAPNDPELWAWVGRMQRELGNWDSALTAFDQARRLDPRDANLLQSIGDLYHYLHRYAAAIEAYRLEMELAPDGVQSRLSMAWSYVMWTGKLDTLRAVLSELPACAEPGMGGASVESSRLVSLMWARLPDSVLAFRCATSPVAATPESRASHERLIADVDLLRSDPTAARNAFAAAAAQLDPVERARPDDWVVHADRGLGLAGAGRRADALREAQWLERSGAYRREPYNSGPAQERARILVRVGETGAALAEIERLLAGPSRLSVGELRLNPDFDPIRSNPRFQALLVKYGHPDVH